MKSDDVPENVCRVCGSVSTAPEYLVREHMFGLDEIFPYFMCGECGCLQISRPPADPSKYYPDNYYSKAAKSVDDNHSIREKLQRRRDEYYIRRRGAIGKMVSMVFPDPSFENVARNLPREGTAKILDVGCGHGNLLKRLHNVGVVGLHGVDPYLREEVHMDGLDITRRDIFALDGGYDLVMFHHSLEHMPDPLRVLAKAREITSAEGRILVRVPTVSSYAWQHYRENWVQIDAPRHYFLFSLESMRLLAEKAGLEIVSVDYDSFGLQFWGSEQNIKGIPLISETSYAVNPERSIFTKGQIRDFEKRSAELNRNGQGDQFAVVMKRKSR